MRKLHSFAALILGSLMPLITHAAGNSITYNVNLDAGTHMQNNGNVSGWFHWWKSAEQTGVPMLYLHQLDSTPANPRINDENPGSGRWLSIHAIPDTPITYQLGLENPDGCYITSYSFKAVPNSINTTPTVNGIELAAEGTQFTQSNIAEDAVLQFTFSATEPSYVRLEDFTVEVLRTKAWAENQLEAYKSEKRTLFLANGILTAEDAALIFDSITIADNSEDFAESLNEAKALVDAISIEAEVLKKLNGHKIRIQSIAAAKGGSTHNYLIGQANGLIHHKDFSLDGVWQIDVDDQGLFTLKNLVNSNYANGLTVTPNETDAMHYALKNASVNTAGSFAIENPNLTVNDRFLNNNVGSSVTGGLQYKVAGPTNGSSFWRFLPVTEELENEWISSIQAKYNREIGTRPSEYSTSNPAAYAADKQIADALTPENLYTTGFSLFNAPAYELTLNAVAPGLLIRIKNYNNTYFSLTGSGASFVDSPNESTIFYYSPYTDDKVAGGHLISLSAGAAVCSPSGAPGMLRGATTAAQNANLGANARNVFFDIAPSNDGRYLFNFYNGNNIRSVYNNGSASIDGAGAISTSTTAYNNYTYTVEQIDEMPFTITSGDGFQCFVSPVAVSLPEVAGVEYYSCRTSLVNDTTLLSFSLIAPTTIIAPNTPIMVKGATATAFSFPVLYEYDSDSVLSLQEGSRFNASYLKLQCSAPGENQAYYKEVSIADDDITFAAVNAGAEIPARTLTALLDVDPHSYRSVSEVKLSLLSATSILVFEPYPIVDGSVYQFVNVGRTGQTAIAIPSGVSGELICKTPDAADLSQLWLAVAVDGEKGFYFRNLQSGTYIKGNSATSGKWQSSDPILGESMTLSELVFEPAGTEYHAFRPKSLTEGQYRFAHENDANYVVTWGSGNNNSRWIVNLVDDFSAEDIAECKAAWNSWISSYVDGGVYRIINVAKPERAVGASASNSLADTRSIADNDEQLWQLTYNADTTGVYLRNLYTAAYLTSPRAVATQWKTSTVIVPNDTVMAFKIEISGGKEVLRPLGQNGNRSYMHNDDVNRIMCWAADNNNSRWTLSLVESISVAEAAEKIAASQALYSPDVDAVQIHLDALFADKACTILNPEISDLQNNEHFLALPEALQQMALKVQSDNYEESNWDDAHARKFRVQLYEPFSRGWEASSMIGVQAYTNMNNPTGIIADARSAVYVMVDEDIPQGGLLTIGAAPGDGVYNDFNGQQTLHRGLNIVPVSNDHSLLYIYYTVDTWDTTTRTRKYKLDDFSPVKIHIEGGDINGHFNAIGDELYAPDTNEDWKYYRERARHNMFDLIGEHIILHFFMRNPEQINKDLYHEFDESVRLYDVPAIIAYWDKLIYYQKMLMGIMSDDSILNDPRSKTIGEGENSWEETLYNPLEGDDICPTGDDAYHHYHNTRMMGLSRNTGYMSGASWTTNYNATTFNAILTNIVNNPGHLWGPAHEHGHVNQQPVKIAGTTEESNNMFSNVAVYYRGVHTARADVFSKQMNVFNSGKTFLDNDIWGTTRMFYQLWLYYHAAGHNRRFYPRLFELLRQQPLEKRGGSAHLLSRYDLLHFAKMCCLAAEEDLTDFFTAWGFFVVQDGYYIGDYSSYYSYISQQDIDEVKAEIKAYNFPKNTSIIFIDDRPGSTRSSWSSDMAIELAGTMGGIQDFKNCNTASGNYSFSLNGNTLTIDGGNGGAGFLLYDSEGNLIGFSNTPTFNLSPEAAKIVATGGATAATVGTDNVEVEILDPVESGTPEQKSAALNTLMGSVRELLDKVDPTERTVGRIYEAAAVQLQTAYNELSEKIVSGIPDDELTSEYRTLADMYYSLLEDDDAYIDIVPGSAYILTNRQYPGRILSTDGSNLTAPVSSDHTNLANQWSFIPVDGQDNTYYIRNEAYHKFVAENTEQSVSIALSDSLARYSINRISYEYLAPYPTTQGFGKGIHINSSGNIVSWNTSSTPTQWVFTLAMSAEEVETRSRLAQLIASNDILLNQTGEFTLSEPENITIQPDSLYTNAPYTETNNNDYTENLDMLVDGIVPENDNKGVYFHSDYSGNNTPDGLNHYIRITLPEHALDNYDYLILFYNNRNNSGNPRAPQAFSVEQSANPDENVWETVYTQPRNTQIVNTAAGARNETDAMRIIPGARSVRFVVNHSDLTSCGHYVFAISEIGLMAGTYTAVPNSDLYTRVSPETLKAARQAGEFASYVIGSHFSSLEDLINAYESLNSAYLALLAEANAEYAELQDLIVATGELLSKVGEVSESAESINLSPEMLYTNAEYTGVNTGDRLNWENLWDDDSSTIFHSNYDDRETADSLEHYIRVALPDDFTDELDRFRFAYTTRNSDFHYSPSKVAVDASINGNDWLELAVFSSELPDVKATEHQLPAVQAPAGTRFIRFRVIESNTINGNVPIAHGHYYFALGEFQLHRMTPACEPSMVYSAVKDTMMNSAFKQMHRASFVLTNSASTNAEYREAHKNLKTVYDTLFNASLLESEPNGLNELSIPDETDYVIFDLQGRRLQNAVRGINIINGVPTLK